MTKENYDPKDEIPVLVKMKTAGWIKGFSENRQDVDVVWTKEGRIKMRDLEAYKSELKLESDNQNAILVFYSRYLAP
ncbi:MAG: hypothetical protein IPN19_14665 [Elusimicrobia bacterium]|nr:hypothetical protein [Elusimicrobiota bacterium]